MYIWAHLLACYGTSPVDETVCVFVVGGGYGAVMVNLLLSDGVCAAWLVGDASTRAFMEHRDLFLLRVEQGEDASEVSFVLAVMMLSKAELSGFSPNVLAVAFKFLSFVCNTRVMR